MIRLVNVSKIYRGKSGEVRAVDQMSLDVASGEYVAVRGPSGCGKSTLLALIGGLALPTSGEVWIDSTRISSLSPAARAELRRERIGFVFQMFHLLPYLSVRDNVVVAARDAAEAKGRVDQLLERFGLADRREHRPGQLSAGERQRVAMARAILNRPEVLLADEPTGNLDPVNAATVLDLLEEFHRDGGTVLLVTHDAEAGARAGRSIELSGGKLAPPAVPHEK